MGELIERVPVLFAIDDLAVTDTEVFRAEVLRLLTEAPTVDAAPVVRCKSCVLHGHCTTEDAFIFARIAEPFCCAGKRMDADAPERPEPKHCGTCYWGSDELPPRCHDCDARTGYYKWEPKRDAPERAGKE